MDPPFRSPERSPAIHHKPLRREPGDRLLVAKFLRRDRNLERRRPSIPRPGLLRTHENGGRRRNAVNRKEADVMILAKELKKRRTELNTTMPTEVKDAEENSLLYFNTMLIKIM